MTRPVPTACATALSAQQRALNARKQVTRAGTEGLITDCELGTAGTWGMDGHTYSRLVTAIEKAEHLRLTRFVGASFGAQRLSYLSARTWDYVALIHPFPVGVPPDEYLTARAAAVERWRQKYLKDDWSSVDPLTRSSALIAAAYLDPESAAQALEAHSAPQSAALAQRLFRQAWQVSGEESVSPARLAYLDEGCRAFRDWREADVSAVDDTVVGVLRQMHAVCPDLRGAPPSSWTPSFRSPYPLVNCLVLMPDDPVTPTQPIASGHSDIHRVQQRVQEQMSWHTSMSGLRKCRRHS